MEPRSAAPRKIIHVDMDAFYASVEMRDRPELQGHPVIVGGSPEGRGVVCCASYEARAFGVHSAQPASRAVRLCPGGIFLKPDFDKYTRISRIIRSIFRRYADLVEPVSLDEAYLDVTADRLGVGSASGIAAAIRDEIRSRTRLTASAGVGPNKFVAKVASDLDKPDGLVVVPPHKVEALVRRLPVRRVPGIGKVTEQQCHRHGIKRCGDFLEHDGQTLEEWFGSAGALFQRLARGIDHRPVVANAARRSISIEDTFASDLTHLEQAGEVLASLAERLAQRVARARVVGRTVTLKVKYSDFQLITRSHTEVLPLGMTAEILGIAVRLLEDTEIGRRPLRLLGIGLSNLVVEEEGQQVLPFPSGGAGQAELGSGGG